MSEPNDIYDVSKYTNEELFGILDVSNPTDRELEARILQLIKKYSNEDETNELYIFFEDIYSHFFEEDEPTELEEQEQDYQEGMEDTTPTDEYRYDIASTTPTASLQTTGTYNDHNADVNTNDTDKTDGVGLTQQLEYTAGSLNPILKETIKRVISIDSQYRDNKITQTSTNFTINLSEALTDVVSLRLYSVQIPYTWYTVNETFGGNRMFIRGITPGIDDGTHDYSIEIPSGNYTEPELITALNGNITELKELFTDISFGDTGFQDYNASNGKTNFTMDIENRYNQTGYNLHFPDWSQYNETDEDLRKKTIHGFLGYKDMSYNTYSVKSEPIDYISAEDPSSKFNITDENRYFTLYIVDNTKTNASIYKTNYDYTQRIELTISNGEWSRAEITDNLYNVIKNRSYLSSESTIESISIPPKSYFLLAIKPSREVTTSILYPNIWLDFPVNNTTNEEKENIWLGSNSCFHFVADTDTDAGYASILLNSTKSELDPLGVEISEYTIQSNPIIKYICNKEYLISPYNNFTVDVSNSSGSTLSEYLNNIKTGRVQNTRNNNLEYVSENNTEQRFDLKTTISKHLSVFNSDFNITLGPGLDNANFDLSGISGISDNIYTLTTSVNLPDISGELFRIEYLYSDFSSNLVINEPTGTQSDINAINQVQQDLNDVFIGTIFEGTGIEITFDSSNNNRVIELTIQADIKLIETDYDIQFLDRGRTVDITEFDISLGTQFTHITPNDDYNYEYSLTASTSGTTYDISENDLLMNIRYKGTDISYNIVSTSNLTGPSGEIIEYITKTIQDFSNNDVYLFRDSITTVDGSLNLSPDITITDVYGNMKISDFDITIGTDLSNTFNLTHNANDPINVYKSHTVIPYADEYTISGELFRFTSKNPNGDSSETDMSFIVVSEGQIDGSYNTISNDVVTVATNFSDNNINMFRGTTMSFVPVDMSGSLILDISVNIPFTERKPVVLSDFTVTLGDGLKNAFNFTTETSLGVYDSSFSTTFDDIYTVPVGELLRLDFNSTENRYIQSQYDTSYSIITDADIEGTYDEVQTVINTIFDDFTDSNNVNISLNTDILFTADNERSDISANLTVVLSNAEMIISEPRDLSLSDFTTTIGPDLSNNFFLYQESAVSGEYKSTNTFDYNESYTVSGELFRFEYKNNNDYTDISYNITIEPSVALTGSYDYISSQINQLITNKNIFAATKLQFDRITLSGELIFDLTQDRIHSENTSWFRNLHIDPIMIDTSFSLLNDVKQSQQVASVTETFFTDLSYHEIETTNIDYRGIKGYKGISQNLLELVEDSSIQFRPIDSGVYDVNNVNVIDIKIPHGKYTRDQLIKNINAGFTNNVNASQSEIGTNNYGNGKTVIDSIINKVFTAKDYSLVLFSNEITGCGSNSGSFGKATVDTTLGYMLGFREKTIYTFVDDTQTITSDSVVTTNLFNYFLISIDDYIQNRLNDGIVTIVPKESDITLPNYANRSNLICNPVSGLYMYDVNSGSNEGNGDTNSNGNNLTQSQIYSMVEIANSKSSYIGSENETISKYGSGPSTNDVFAIVPMKLTSLQPGQSYVEFGGTLQQQERVYFGPVNIQRMTIKLVTDRGTIVDLNGANWSFSIICEQLYKQQS